jgi:hypothetical protein
MSDARDQLLLLTLKLHHYVMDDLYFVGGCSVMGELAHLTHRIRVDS